MDAGYTGKKISECRKKIGLTQKELAGMLHVTDKAVSKWERGLNFPDISILEDLAEALQISVVELLGVEEASSGKVVSEMTELAQNEKKKIAREIYNRGWLTVIFGLLVWAGIIYASKVLADHDLYGLPQIATAGMSGCIGVIIANGIVSIRKGKNFHL